MSTGARQKCRLFLEGREVPFISATLICNVGEPITAVVNLVPLAEIKAIKPKTMVSIFVQDTNVFRTVDGSSDQNFHLAFEGEVVGRAMQKRQDGRSFQVTAVDFSGYWDEAQAYYYNPNFLVGKFEGTMTGEPPPPKEKQAAGATTFTGVATTSSLMIDFFTKAGSDLAQGVANIFKALSDINLFYKTAWTRLRMNDRVRVFSSGNLSSLLQDIKQLDFLKSFTGSQGGIVSLRAMLLDVMGLIFHTFISVPFPSRVNVSATVGKTKAKSFLGQTIGSFLFVPDGYCLPPPKCNVIFPNQIVSFEMSEDFRASPTRFAFRTAFSEFIQAELKVSTYPTQYYPSSFSDYMFKRRGANKTETEAEAASQLGSSTLLTDSKGQNYKDVVLNNNKSKAVGGTSVSNLLRESDFMTNEESVKGIFLATDTIMPSMGTMSRTTKVIPRTEFIQKIGGYLFFKKKFAARQGNAQLLFNPYLVPGFNAFLIDDSDAGQTVIGKIQNVMHNLSHDAASTSVSLAYVRDFDEIDYLTGGTGEPPLPPWYDPDKFGFQLDSKSDDTDKDIYRDETTFLTKYAGISEGEIKARNKIKNPVLFDSLSGFYQYLLGIDAVTDVDTSDKNNKSKLVTVRGAATFLTHWYKNISSTPLAQDIGVFNYIKRPVPTLADTFFFLGAKPTGLSGVIPDEFASFEAVTTGPSAGIFDGKGYPDGKVLAIRRAVIDKYVLQLRTKRGFRG